MTIINIQTVSRNPVIAGDGLIVPASTALAAPYGASGPLISGTSTTPNTIDTDLIKMFEIQEYNRSFYPGTRIRATAVDFENVWLEGIVTSWDGKNVWLDGDLSSDAGVGAYSNWHLNVAGERGVVGPEGPQGIPGAPGGPAGPPGAQGSPGTPGSVWRNGNGLISNTIGRNGDYYLNDSNGDVYLKSADIYSLTANIEGAPGVVGSVWRNGNGSPSGTLGIDGDYYLDDVTGNVHFKAAGSYSIVANIAGPVGPTGPQGIIPDAPSDGIIYGRRNATWVPPPGGGDVQSARTLTAGAGLTGGGDLSANRTFAVGAGTGILVNVDDVAVNVSANFTWSGAHTFNNAVAAASFVPTSGAAPTNGMYLAAANTLGWAINGAAELQLSATAFYPNADGGLAFGTASLAWNGAFFSSGSAMQFGGSGKWIATHFAATVDFVTIGPGDLRVATAGADAASVVTVGGSQTLQNKTLVSPFVTSTLYLTGVNAGVEFGASGTSNTPYFDFHSSATANDYDVRFLVTGGTATSGQGNLSIYGAAVTSAGIVNILSTEPSTTSTSGALIVAGGVGIAGKLHIANNIVINCATPTIEFRDTGNNTASLSFLVSGAMQYQIGNQTGSFFFYDYINSRFFLRMNNTANTMDIGASNVDVLAPRFGVTSDRGFKLSGQTSSAGSATATMTNAPVAGNPFWLKVVLNGANYAIPCWAG